MCVFRFIPSSQATEDKLSSRPRKAVLSAAITGVATHAVTEVFIISAAPTSGITVAAFPAVSVVLVLLRLSLAVAFVADDDNWVTAVTAADVSGDAVEAVAIVQAPAPAFVGWTTGLMMAQPLTDLLSPKRLIADHNISEKGYATVPFCQ